MDKELEQLRQVFAGSQVFVRKCGIGKVNAALGAQQLINEEHPDVIVSSGCAGGNGDEVNVQDVVVSAELCYHDVYCGTAIDNTTVYGQVQGLPARFKADPYLLGKALELTANVQCSTFNVQSSMFNGQSSMVNGQSSMVNGQWSMFNVKIHPGLIVTGDWFVDSREKMREIVSHFPEARAVDMESCAIAQTCHLNRVPFISFRVISDIPLRDTDASQYHDFWATIAQNSFQVTRTFIESL